MKMPSPQQVQNAILGIIRDKDRVTEADAYSFLLFEFGLYAGGPAPLSPTDRWRFTALVVGARKRLIGAQLLHATEDSSFQITPRGRAYLSMGFTKLDAQSRLALASIPVEETPQIPLASIFVPGGDEPAADGDASTDDSETTETDKLKALLEGAKLKHLAGDNGTYVVPIEGKLGSWLVIVRESHGWLCLSTHVLNLPKEPSAKSNIIESAMRMNAKTSVWKSCLTKFSELRLEAEYRMEHVDSDALKSLVWMLEGSISEQCAKLVRLAIERQPLDALEQAFKRSA